MHSNSVDSGTNIPEYEYPDVNTNIFHIGSFRNEWLKRLDRSNYAYEKKSEDTFDANFAKEMGMSADTLADLKSICR